MSHGSAGCRQARSPQPPHETGGRIRGLVAYSAIWADYSTRPRGARLGSTGGSVAGSSSSSAWSHGGSTRGSPTDGCGVCTSGVYAVGHEAPSVLGDYMAAVLACGDGHALSHRAAAHVMRLLPGKPPPPEVTVPTLAGRGRPGILIHRVKALHRLDVCSVRRHPDDDRSADAARPRPGARRSSQLDPRLPRGVDPPRHDAALRRGRASRATPARRAPRSCAPRSGPTRRSASSRSAFLALLRAHGLPAPRTNVDRRGDKVDCHWPQLDLTVELVSYRFHGSRRRSRLTSPAAGARTTSRSAGATCSSAARRPIAELAAAMTRPAPPLASAGHDPPARRRARRSSPRSPARSRRSSTFRARPRARRRHRAPVDRSRATTARSTSTSRSSTGACASRSSALPARINVDVRSIDRDAVVTLAEAGKLDVALVRDAGARRARRLPAARDRSPRSLAGLALGVLVALAVRGGRGRGCARRSRPRSATALAIGARARRRCCRRARTSTARSTTPTAPRCPTALRTLGVARRVREDARRRDRRAARRHRAARQRARRPRAAEPTLPRLTVASDLHNNVIALPGARARGARRPAAVRRRPHRPRLAPSSARSCCAIAARRHAARLRLGQPRLRRARAPARARRRGRADAQRAPARRRHDRGRSSRASAACGSPATTTRSSASPPTATTTAARRRPTDAAAGVRRLARRGCAARSTSSWSTRRRSRSSRVDALRADPPARPLLLVVGPHAQAPSCAQDGTLTTLNPGSARRRRDRQPRRGRRRHRPRAPDLPQRAALRAAGRRPRPDRSRRRRRAGRAPPPRRAVAAR